MSDSVFGVSSPYGFRSMFKEESATEAVEAIFNAIYYSKARVGLSPEPKVLKSPRFACVTEDSAQIYRSLDLDYDPWQRCLVSGSPRHTPVPAFYAEGTAYIFLCPAFFVQEDHPTSPHCPAVHHNRFAGDPNVFYRNYQTYTLMYQFIRFYLGDNALDSTTDPPEQFDWNNCVHSLGMLNSVRNPTNLQLYIACKWHLFHLPIPLIFP